jgi:hypothetical protein
MSNKTQLPVAETLFLNVDVPTLLKHVAKNTAKGIPYLYLSVPGTSLNPEKYFVHSYKVEQGFNGVKCISFKLEHAELGVVKVNTTEHLDYIRIRL